MARMRSTCSVAVGSSKPPPALCAPSTFWHQLHTSDDASMRWQYGTFLRVVRLIGMLIHLFLPGAMGNAKRLVHDLAGKRIDHGLMEDTARRIAHARVSEEGQEGVRAFLEKRAPAWSQ